MKGETQSTHWAGCYEFHHGCAVARISELEREMSDLKEVVRGYASTVRKAAALLLDMAEKDLGVLRKEEN